MKKIVSWNMDCNNGDERRIDEFLRDTEADVVCLQEVSLSLKKHIEELFCGEYPFITSAIDHHCDGIFELAPKRTTSHLMILSKYPFEGTPIKHIHKRSKSRTLFGWFKGWHECIEHHSVDIVLNGTLVRVVNIHIACAETPKNKWKQFRRAVKPLKFKGSTVVCGDFNITRELTFWHSIPYGIRIISGSRFSIQEFLQKKEIRIFSRIIKKVGLEDKLGKWHITHPTSGLALDKILISHDLSDVSEVYMFHDMYGSDHPPFVMEISPKT